jgi:glutathione-regulated potassium-efflux system ancillary protein KefC
MGLTLALSSTALVMQTLHERADLTSRHGTAAFAVLLMQDLAVVPLLAIVPILSDVGTLSSDVPFWQQILVVAGMVALVFGFGRYLVPIRAQVSAASAQPRGLYPGRAAGGLFGGRGDARGGSLDGARRLHDGDAALDLALQLPDPGPDRALQGLLMSLFFVAVGMSIDLEAIAAQPLLLAQHVGVILAIKLVVLLLVGMAFGLPRGTATRVAFMLAQSGEFGFVLFGSAKVLGVIDDATFVIAVSVISVSMLLTPLLVRIGDVSARRLEHRTAAPPTFEYPATTDGPAKRVVIAGYGRVGHTVATLLEANNIPFIAFDTNPAHVERGEQDGRAVYFGDIGDVELLEAAQVDKAALVILTIDHGPTALRAVSHIRTAYPKVPVIARARDLEACGSLIRAGATLAYPEAIESSLRLGAEALQMLGISTSEVDSLLQGVRSEGYAQVVE